MKTLSTILLALAATLAGCASVPTPSGLPELRVSIKPTEARERICEHLVGGATLLTAASDAGVTTTRMFTPPEAFFVGSNQRIIRYNLSAIPQGTQINASVTLAGPYVWDVSNGGDGLDVQRKMEQVFAGCMIDGPFTKPRR